MTEQTLASLPPSWRRARLAHLVSTPIKAGVDYSAEAYLPGHLRYIRTTDISGPRSLTPQNEAVGVTDAQAVDALVVRGDVLITRSGSLGTSYIHDSDEVAAYAGYLVRVRLDPNLYEPEFMGWWSQSQDHIAQVDVGATRSTMDNFSAGKMAALQVPFPPLTMQHRIADYLDRETATIDTLIEKQRLLVTTLHERRRAAVDLEVEKLSRVHETVSYRRVVRSIRQGWSPQANNWPAEPGDWAVLKAGAVNHGRFNALQNKELPEELDPRPGTQVRPGDLVISRANTRELVGSAAVYLGEANSGLMLSDKLYALRHEVSVNPRFVALVLGSSRWRRLIELEATGASPSMQNISQDVILSLPMFVPPFDEQRRIADHLDEETAKIDALIANAERFIELAQERRAALITAAVTGQISVD